jgi:hypothetical protein
MNTEILQYIQGQRTGVLAVEMLDGSPHAATLHFASSDVPFLFFFETNQNYRKSESLIQKHSTRASLVVGFDENEMKTFQSDGIVRIVSGSDKKLFDEVYFGKFPDKIKNKDNPDVIFFMFIPQWWRFTDWKTPGGKKIMTSN